MGWDWIEKLEAQLEADVAKLRAGYDRLKQLKAQVWELATRHPEFRSGLATAFHDLRGLLSQRSLLGVSTLVADVERVIADSKAAAASEADALSAILAGLKGLAE